MLRRRRDGSSAADGGEGTDNGSDNHNSEDQFVTCKKCGHENCRHARSPPLGPSLCLLADRREKVCLPSAHSGAQPSAG